MLSDGEQTLVVSRQTGHGLDAVPVDRVDGVGGLVGVVIALLGSAELGARGHKGDTLRGEQEGVDLLHLALEVGVGACVIGGAVTLDDLVPHDEVVVGVRVSDRLSRTLRGGCLVNLASDAGYDAAGVGGGIALNEALAGAVGVALDGVAVLVAEGADARVKTGDTGALPGEDRIGVRVGAAVPGLAVHEDLLTGAVGVEAVEVAADLVHGGDVMQTHEVEAEAVDMILLHPVAAGLDHELAEHLLVGSSLVAAAGAVGEHGAGAHAVVVAGSCLFKAGGGVVGVVVNDVHDDGDASVVERLDHLLEFPDSDVAVIGVGGIGALGGVVVLRIVAPVAVCGRGSRLVH